MAHVLTLRLHPKGGVSCQAKAPSAPSPTHTPPGIQVVLVLLHFPAARVAAVYQVVGSKVHTIDLCHQSLHLLVQDVKPDMERKMRTGEEAWALCLLPSLWNVGLLLSPSIS